nr:hypothetical protein TetV2_00625 [Oceanusvirus sp.]
MPVGGSADPGYDIVFCLQDEDVGQGDCKTGHLSALKVQNQKNTFKLSWSVVALFSDKEWAKQLNLERWTIVTEIIKSFGAVAYTLDERDKKTDFVVGKHANTISKLFVSESEKLSLTCSTKVDSDVDVTFYGLASVFVQSANTIIQNLLSGTDDRFQLMKLVYNGGVGNVANDATFLARAFDVEIFDEGIEFPTPNVRQTRSDDGEKWVPIMTLDTWDQSQIRLKKHFENQPLVPPLTDESDITESPEERVAGEKRIGSDGYYTRPAYMFVASPNDCAVPSDADAECTLTNKQVVWNSERARLMVALENLGFSLEYLSPEHHGLCPVNRTRANKIAKYAQRIVDVLCGTDGDGDVKIKTMCDGDVLNWWKGAAAGRESRDSLAQAFSGVELDEDMGKNGPLKILLEEKVTGILKIIRTNTSAARGKVGVGGGGSGVQRSASAWAFAAAFALTATAAFAHPPAFR